MAIIYKLFFLTFEDAIGLRKIELLIYFFIIELLLAIIKAIHKINNSHCIYNEYDSSFYCKNKFFLCARYTCTL